ncbi:methyltransferase domain-containing protein [Cupriavidus sp. PET2-C1]
MEPVSVKAIMFGPRGILFVKNPRDELELPGGRPEAGEGLEAALVREVSEECGLNITTTSYLGSRSCEIIPGRRVLLVFFLCEFTGQGLTLSDEHTAYEWIDVATEKPEILPSFYWDFCQNLDCVRMRRLHATHMSQKAAATYPLQTGESDRQRLQIMSSIYDPATKDFLRRYLPTEGRILEVGSGHGQIACWMATRSARSTVLGLDISPSQIDLATSAAQRLGLTNLTFRVRDAIRFPDALRSEGAFDLITCRFTLLHIKERAEVIQTLLAQLSPSGTLVMEEPSLASPFSVPAVAAFEEANAVMMAYGWINDIEYDYVEDIWPIVTGLDVNIKEARFSQPTVWKKEHKEVVYLSFQQFRPQLIKRGLLDDERAETIAQSLAREFMDDAVISGGMRTLQIAISPRGEGA